MVTPQKLNSTGAASMVVVIFFSIIISIVTIGFIRLAINEQRQSTDLDLSQRAYYAAESGLEDARRAVGEYLSGELLASELNADTCDVPDGYDGVLDTEFDIEYTCMFIDLTPADYEVSLDAPNQTKQVKLRALNPGGGSPNIGSMTIEWHINAASPEGDGLLSADGGSYGLRGATANNMPQFGSWGNTPAMMEMQFIAYPNNITAASIRDNVSFLSPNNGGAGVNQQVFLAPSNPNPTVNGQVLPGECSDVAVGEFVCRATYNLNQANSNEIVLRMTNHYAATNVRLTMTTGPNSGGQTLLFADAQASVDVTGRASTVYRRVEANLDLQTLELLPDYTVQTAEDICKNFSFTTSLSNFSAPAGTSCN